MPKTSQGEQRTRPSSPPKGKAVNGIRSVGRNRWEVRINAGKDPVTGRNRSKESDHHRHQGRRQVGEGRTGD